MNNLAREIKNGNQSSFNFFYKAEFDNLLFFINNYVKDLSLAKDIVQDSFIALWCNRTSIDETKNLRTFIYTIAKNKAVNVLKSKYYQLNKTKALELKAEIYALSSDEITNRIDALDVAQLIEKTYENLPKTVKESFELSRKKSLTNKEIADQLGVSVRSVEHHIQTSLKIFRKKLKDYLLFLCVL
jgi:RNA polymerase sigma-70 factor, ECF subfamily